MAKAFDCSEVTRFVVRVKITTIQKVSKIRFFIPLILLFSGWLHCLGNTSSWNWHQQFPWVYNDAESDWHYWRAGTDGQFYIWKNRDQAWYRFDDANSKWISTAWDSYFSNSNNSDNKDNNSKDSSNNQNGNTSNSLSQSVTVNGVSRQYLLYIPSSYTGTSQVPLLFNFHGYGGTSNGHMYAADMRSLADKEKFILVYPQGSLLDGAPHWNASPTGSDNKSTANDTGFVDAMITSISSTYRIDNTRIYACGYSNGAMMSYFLGGSMSDKIAAIGSMSGTMLDGNPTPSSPVPMISIHGTNDYVITYTGGSGYSSITQTLRYWAEQNGASATPALTNLTSGTNTIVEKSVYTDSKGTPWVEHYKVVGGGHAWIDLNLNGSNANQLIWDFFNKHDLNGPRDIP